MKEALHEQLSACLDGELPSADLDLLLKQVSREAGLRAAIGRYSLIGEAMRAERPAVASRDFASKVMAAVAAEAPSMTSIAAEAAPAVATTNVHSLAAARTAKQSSEANRKTASAVSRYLRPVVGMAIAASVAAIAVLTVQPAGQPEIAGSESAQVAAIRPVAVSADEGPSYVVPTSTSTSAFIPATRLTNYVVAHSEYSSPLGRRSVLSGVLADDEDHNSAVDETLDVMSERAGQDAGIQVSITDDGAP